MKCYECEEPLDEEQSANPMRGDGGEIICDDCHREGYQDDCHRCQNTVDKTELESNPGELIAVIREASGMPDDLEPGYYRVKAWPFFHDGMISGYFDGRNLERVADLDRLGLGASEDTLCAAIPLCLECRQSLTPNTETAP